jgi:hypothetical protein
VASAADHPELLRYLIEQTDMSEDDAAAQNGHIFYAIIQSGQLPSIVYLFEHWRFYVNDVRANSCKALHTACRAGNVQSIRYLLEDIIKGEIQQFGQMSCQISFVGSMRYPVSLSVVQYVVPYLIPDSFYAFCTDFALHCIGNLYRSSNQDVKKWLIARYDELKVDS